MATQKIESWSLTCGTELPNQFFPLRVGEGIPFEMLNRTQSFHADLQLRSLSVIIFKVCVGSIIPFPSHKLSESPVKEKSRYHLLHLVAVVKGFLFDPGGSCLGRG